MTPSSLDTFKTGGFPSDYPPDRRRFYSPVDNIPAALRYTIRSAQQSLYLAMYGFDDPTLAGIVKTKLETPGIVVQITLDKSQAEGEHEKEILSQEDYPTSSIAIGDSEKHAIMHLKQAVVDGLIVIDGSTNWSVSGETEQDNSLVISWNRIEAADATARLNAIHNYILNHEEP